MGSDGSFELLEDISAEDFQMAEQVASNHKNDENAVSLAQAGTDASSFDLLTSASKVDLEKLLAYLTQAMEHLQTKEGY